MTIHLLDEETINQIAAGEVVENSASVVKELVENALDAGASLVTIEIVAGGKQLIRVSDNGKGMNEADALLSLKRHATSKIISATDLAALVTMGFRGEALAAISSVSKLRLVTNADVDETKAFMVVQEGGQVVETTRTLAPRGTSIEVRALFYNTPARRKFQKSIQADTAALTKVVEELALANPQVGFDLVQGAEKILTRPPESLETRLKALLGDEQWIKIEANEGPYSLSGYISDPSLTRSNRSGQFLFINKRAVTSPLVSLAVLEGYGTLLSTKRYPLFVLHLSMEPHLVDVNVHPQKEEVRLQNEAFLRGWLARAVSLAFHQPQSKPALPWEAPPSFSLPQVRIDKPLLSVQLAFDRPSFPLIGQWKQHLFIDPSDVPARHNLSFTEETVMILHRERARHTLLAAQFLQEEPPAAHYLTEPVIVELSAHEARLLQGQDFTRWGFVIRPFGPRTFMVEALPGSVTEVKEVLLALITGGDKPALLLARSLKKDTLNPVLWLDAFFALEQIRWAPDGEPNFFLCALNNYKKS